MKLQTWTCANGCGEWTSEVPECFQYNGAEVLCVFCLVKQNSYKVFEALAEEAPIIAAYQPAPFAPIQYIRAS